MKKQTMFSLMAGSVLVLTTSSVFAGAISDFKNLPASSHPTIQQTKLEQGIYKTEMIKPSSHIAITILSGEEICKGCHDISDVES